MRRSKTEDSDKKDGIEGAVSIVMNETAEFCRALGDIPTYGQSGNREDEDDIMVGSFDDFYYSLDILFVLFWYLCTKRWSCSIQLHIFIYADLA